MAAFTGTYDISSLLEARFQSVAEFGRDNIAAILAAELEAHNTKTREMLDLLVEFSTDRQRKYGSAVDADEMMEVDEYGRAPTKKVKPGSTVAFPLRLFQFNLGWTAKWMQTHTPADMAQLVQSAEMSHVRRIQREIQRAVYRSANYTFRDHLVDNVDLTVRRFLNADGEPIPAGPNGEVFDGGTETHYLGATAAWSGATDGQKAGDLKTLIDQLLEKGHGGDVILVAHRDQESDITALTATNPRFREFSDSRLNYQNETHVRERIDFTRLDNRPIGLFDAATVWIKPWAVSGYIFAFDPTSDKPLVFRQRQAEGLRGLRIAHEHETFPLTAQFMEAEYGIGVYTRTNGAVLDTANGSYTDPTL